MKINFCKEMGATAGRDKTGRSLLGISKWMHPEGSDKKQNQKGTTRYIVSE